MTIYPISFVLSLILTICFRIILKRTNNEDFKTNLKFYIVLCLILTILFLILSIYGELFSYKFTTFM